MTDRNKSPASAGGEDEADAIWNEATAAPEGEAARSEEEPEAEAKGEETNETEDNADFSGDESGDEPDIEARLAEAPEWVRRLVTKQRDDMKRLEQSERSQRGRYAAAQARLDAWTKQTPPKGAEEAEDKGGALTALDALKEDYPDIAGPIAKAIAELKQEIGAVNGFVAQNEQGRIAEEQARVIEEHPDFGDILSKHGAVLDEWIEDQPKRLRDAYQVNANSIVDGPAANLVMGEFKKHLAKQGLIKPNNAALRERQRAGADIPPGRRSGPSISGIPREGDADDIWNAITR